MRNFPKLGDSGLYTVRTTTKKIHLPNPLDGNGYDFKILSDFK